MSDLVLDIKYDIEAKPQRFYIATNVKQKLVHDLIGDYLHGVVGSANKRVKDGPAAKRGVYTVRMRVDLSDDSFQVQDDTNSISLLVGIMVQLMTVLQDAPERVEWVENIYKITAESERRSNSEDGE